MRAFFSGHVASLGYDQRREKDIILMSTIPTGYVKISQAAAMINLNQLRVFKAIFEQQSITGAARQLRISQPAVSKQLAELEHGLGVALVDRLPRGIRLTEAGRVLEAHARRIFAAEEAAENALAQLLGLQRGSLSVGASTTIGNYLVPSVFGQFHLEHPQVKLQLEIGNTAMIQQAVADGRLDLGLTEGLVGGDALTVEVFAHDEMVAILSPHHPLALNSQLPLEQLSRVAWVCRERGSGTRDVIEAALARHGVELTPAMSLGSTEAVKHAVSLGLGVALVSRLAVELEVVAGRLVALPVEGLQLRRALHLVTLRSKHANPAATEFVRLLHERYPTPVD